MKVVAVIGQKGGPGKTTTAENVAVAASEAGHTVVLIDLDSQCTSTKWGDRRAEFFPTREFPAVVSAQGARLKKVLADAKAHGATFVVIDTPPRMAEGSLEAAKAADLVLVPVRPLMNDLETLPALKEVVLFAGAPATWVLINAAPVQGGRKDEARLGSEAFGFKVAPVVLHHRAAFHDAPIKGEGVTEFEPNGKAAEEVKGLYKFVSKQLNVKTPERVRAHV